MRSAIRHLRTFFQQILLPCWHCKLPYLLFLLPCALILLSEAVFARVGGGQRYPGGGGGGGGDGGGGFLIYLLIRLCFEYPVVGIPLLIIVLIVMYKSSQKANTYNQSRVIHKGRERQNEYNRMNAVITMKQKDPGFDKQIFLNRVRTAFFRLQDAWGKQDMRPTRHFLSDAVFERFSIQLNILKDQGVRDQMEHLTVQRLDIVQLQSDEVFDTVTVRIDASAVDYRVSLKTGKYVEGSKTSEAFTEYWSFVRRPGAAVKTGKGLIEGNCPNCGDSLEMNEAAQCASCGAIIKSGEYDWVLAEITQAAEWQAAEARSLPGVGQIRKSDPGFSVQHIEDRTSVMFWRTMEAYRTGKIEPLRKVAMDEFCELFAQTHLRPNEKGERTAPDDVAVGSVETLDVAMGPEWDTVPVQIRWSSVKTVLDAQGKRKSGGIGASIYTHVYITKRKHGVKSNLARALSSAHCSNCGAPAQQSTSNACDYCGTVLNTGTQDWVLDSIEFAASDKVRDLRAQLGRTGATSAANTPATPPPMPSGGISGGLEATAWLINVMLADGKIDPKEQKLIYDYTDTRRIPRQQAEQLLQQAIRAGKLDAPEPRSPQEARAWLTDMVRMSLADGFVSKEEGQLLLRMGKKLGFSGHDITLLINKVRKAMYQEAKQTLRHMK